MADTNDFMKKVEARFAAFPEEKQKEKLQEYRERYEALLQEGKTPEEARAILEKRLSVPEVAAPVKEDYGRISHPKKPLLTGTLYAIALAIFVAGAILFQRLFS